MEDFVIICDILVKYTGQDSVVKIPDNITSIGAHAFSWSKTVTKVEIPNSVTTIEESAFSGCTELTSIEIPDSVTEIKFGTFNGCKKLKSVKIPNLVTEIKDNAFIGCFSLTNIEIPNNVTTIGEEAFAYCKALTTIKIPNSVTCIRWNAFEGCELLTSIDVAEDNKNYASIDGVLYNKDKKILIQCPGGKTSIEIPDSVTRIEASAFWDCAKLKEIIIPNSVTNIVYTAFNGCTALNFNEYDNALYLGSKDNPYAFLICAKLTDITTCVIKDTCKCIGKRAFKGREGLTSIIIPDSVTTIGRSAFLGCTGLTSVTIGNGVTSIGEAAFERCAGLTSVTIPNNITSIEAGAFYRCPKLTNIIIGDNVKSIGSEAFGHCKIKHKPKGNIAYKGFLVNMTCRDFQYKEGETYVCDTAILCNCGFHACLNPLDCFNYYSGNYVVYHEVILEDRSSETGDDSKICGKKITIGRQLTIQEMFAIFNELNKE